MMRPFDWTLIQSFLAVAETGSHSAAARETGRSQPTIGRHVDALQDQLGAVLFQRGDRGYDLTDTGRALMDHALAMRDSAARVSLIAAGQAEDPHGTVRITASEIVATYLLPGLIARLIAEEPGLQVELVSSNATQNLLRREADIAVRMTRPTQSGLIARKIGGIEIGVYAAPSYIDAKGAPETLDQLRDHVLLGYDASDLILRGMQEFGLAMRREDFAFRCDDQVAYVEALVAGVGVGFAQSRLAQARGMVRLFPNARIPPLPVWLTAHEELRTSARVRFVFDWLARELPAVLREP